ncbi:aspartate-semialdehyde dehydrogenase [Phycisphaera mikurensis]|uniref:Aspartate-semialdehyde dehydrogenase n=1 Tax=Phycisphaera mikurensis (strain NBRC 102666 / KCTC 22515 / FYK2301M01) TaxID=1142394 RepID=I0IBB1_PHYMF|nr:aspartate-semialdehyde dehydrogenase [Phycisphaera mikurensis]MBB6443044.1 aspartate-semialdehyde dehydrogenase [Phycisphaera mikurensis]BAM02549.1 aspartate-semialdehyde dehydrogenase [Phycisphaera mikurensis NBRC 102666]
MARTHALESPSVAIAGVTGAVGQEFLAVLAERNFPIGRLKLLASARSAGREVAYGGKTHTIEELKEDSFEGVDLALFSAGGGVSKAFAPLAVDAGCTVIDNSSAFRMAEGVPLVVPEVNPDAIAQAGIGLGAGGRSGIVANPNCSTILMLVVVHPLHAAAGVERIVASTYQAASGGGAAAMSELEQQTRESLDEAGGREVRSKAVFGRTYAFNLFSHNSPLQPNGYNQEELKMVHETHKIWRQDALPEAARTGITATCIRVPVMRAHAESLNLAFTRDLHEDEARELLAAAPGVVVVDDRATETFPTPLDASGTDPVQVGRIRRDLSRPAGRGLDLFLCGDQIRKGAALNAVQIAELLIA